MRIKGATNCAKYKCNSLDCYNYYSKRKVCTLRIGKLRTAFDLINYNDYMLNIIKVNKTLQLIV